MNIIEWNVREWDVPMRWPYRSAQRLTTTAHNILLSITLEGGVTGLGESAPATYVTGETQSIVVDSLRRFLGNQTTLSTSDVLARSADELKNVPGARGALEIAVQDAVARSKGVPLYRLLNTADQGEVSTTRSTDLSLPILPPEEAYRRASDAEKSGFRAIKIKVGAGDREEDIRRVRAVAEGAPDAKLRLDGNQGFTADSALVFLEGLTDLYPRIQLFEQPTPAGDDAAMKKVHRSLPESIPVFADESCHNESDARRLIEEEICGGVVLKLAKSGLSGAEAIARATYAAGGVCLFGCMMETRIGIAAALHLTIALGEKVVPLLDLDGHLLTDDSTLLSGGFSQRGDEISLLDGGIGLNISLR